MDTSTLFAIAACLLAIFLLQWLTLPRKLPPGPFGFPILGYIPFLSRKPYCDFQRLAKRYGNVFSIHLGSVRAIVISDLESSKKAFSMDSFMGRPPEFPMNFNQETIETQAILGLPWKGQRRFSLMTLKDLGLGKSKIEGHILDEIEELVEHLKENVGKPYKINKLLAPSMSNIIGTLLFGRRLAYDDPAKMMMSRVVGELSATVSQTSWREFFPWVKTTLQFLGLGIVDKIAKLQIELKDYIRMEISEHEKTFDPSNIRDYIDGYLFEIGKRKDEPAFCKQVLEDIAMLFFGAGSETVRTSLEWLVLTAAEHQDAQQRIQREIDDAVGLNQPIVWTDHSSMPYTEAFINELWRWRTIVPLNLLRYALADGELNGYFIPKGSQLLSNLWAIHHDPEYWGQDVDEFRPDRFLTNDQAVKKWEHFIPFSIGKRACPGEMLAKVEVFLYFTSILQKFNLRLPDGRRADYEGELGVTLYPKPQDIIYTLRS